MAPPESALVSTYRHTVGKIASGSSLKSDGAGALCVKGQPVTLDTEWEVVTWLRAFEFF
jgi:hypothetical protein